MSTKGKYHNIDATIAQARAWAGTGELELAEIELDKAINDYRSANARCAHYGLRLLALCTREVAPEATTLVLDWSDQGGGDFLTLVGVEDAQGNLIQGDDFDPEDWAGNLAENNQDIWGPLSKPKWAGPEMAHFTIAIETVLAWKEAPNG